jgi:hypothetical protein
MNTTQKTIETIEQFTITPVEGIWGTCLQGYISATRDQLVTVFGQPGDGDGGYKFFFDWAIEIKGNNKAGITAMIYDWKYDQVFPAGEKIEWNIGGYSREAVDAVSAALQSQLGLTSDYLKARYA